MILIDISQIAIANIMMTPNLPKNELDENLVKHMILASLKTYKQKFFDEYGDLVICCDGHKGWRKKEFAHYKATRKKDRDDSFMDWTMIYNAINSFKDDLRENFPYKIIEVAEAEADDVIAILCRDTTEKTLIVSSDKDHGQLQKLSHVDQYCPRNKALIKLDDPEAELRELIIRGDRSDGIPNIKSDADTFVTDGKRQGSITKDFLSQAMQEIPQELKENWDRNNKLINYDLIPEDVCNLIREARNADDIVGNKNKMYNYFMKKKMRNLLTEIGQF